MKFDNVTKNLTKMLNTMIEDKCTHIQFLNEKLTSLNNKLTELLTPSDFQLIKNKCHHLDFKVQKSLNNKHRVKFNSLCTSTEVKANPKWFVNLTDIDVSPDV